MVNNAFLKLPWLLFPLMFFASLLEAEDGQNAWKNAKENDPVFMDPNPVAIKNKLKFLHRLSNTSPLIERAQQSGCEDVRLLIQSAIDAHRKGEKEFEQNNLEDALEYAGRGLRAMMTAARMLPDKDREKKIEQVRYEQLHAHFLSLKKTLKRIENNPVNDPHSGLDDLIMKSGQLSEKGDYKLASYHLARVIVDLEAAINKAYGTDTLVYELGFDTPEEEYRHEDRRNKEYITLVEFLEQQNTLPKERASMITGLREKNTKIRYEAEALAKSGSFNAAIKKMEDGTRSLANALRSAGLAVQ